MINGATFAHHLHVVVDNWPQARNDVVTTGVFSLLAAVVGGILVIIGQIYFQRRQDQAIRDQILFLLRSVSVQMAMVRDHPKYYKLRGFDSLLELLRTKALSTQGSVALNKTQRATVLEALAEAEHSGSYIEQDQERALKSGDTEYIQAAAQRAFAKLGTARQSLGDSATLTKPVDPRELHNWQPGAEIKTN